MTQNEKTKLILIEPFVLPVGPRKTHYVDFYPVFQKKQEVIHRIADDYRIIWIPVQKKLEALTEETTSIFTQTNSEMDPYAYWLWDGVHPTEAMHDVLADLWLKGAESILDL